MDNMVIYKNFWPKIRNSFKITKAIFLGKYRMLTKKKGDLV